jgi:hypothetical protein
MGKIDRKRTRCCNKYVCHCADSLTFHQKYPWKNPAGANADKYSKGSNLKIHERTDLKDKRKWVQGKAKSNYTTINKLKW